MSVDCSCGKRLLTKVEPVGRKWYGARKWGMVAFCTVCHDGFMIVDGERRPLSDDEQLLITDRLIGATLGGLNTWDVPNPPIGGPGS